MARLKAPWRQTITGHRGQNALRTLQPARRYLQFRKFAKRDSDTLKLDFEIDTDRCDWLRFNARGDRHENDQPTNPNLFAIRYAHRRVIDDFIFFCMLVGNDFLPHCPHLSIDSGALSLMLNIYTNSLPKMGGYLTKGEKVRTGEI